MIRSREDQKTMPARLHRFRSSLLPGLLALTLLGCGSGSAQQAHIPDTYAAKLAAKALTLTEQDVEYDPAYFSIPYPNGDVPAGKGVCTDVVVRSYRLMGADLQQLVHEDMKAHFDLYPKKWGLSRPDPNIDHRRVPNLMTFFERFGTVKPITDNSADYVPGDIVAWDLGSGVTHIGVVSNKRSSDGERHLIVHNIGAGQVLEDCLFSFTIIGHYSYEKPEKEE